MSTPTDTQPDAAAPEAEAEPIPTTEGMTEPEGTVTFTSPTGSLDLAPTQTRLRPEQRAAIAAITNADPDAQRTWPHLRVFLHTCQKMALDPWRKQAYLIARGSGDNQKFTIQVGIDGYRTVAARTRLIIGAATWLWTGTDDDDKTWRFNEATGVMQRVWYDEWPESRGYPGAAKAVIRHFDALGNVVVSDAVAHWGMYAPFYPKVEWVNNRKVYVKDDDGKDVMELGEMWAKGPAHMLAKCAEALVLRKVFPDEFAGTVTFEEMARADMEERQRREREQAAARKQAFAAAKARQQEAPSEQPGEPAPAAEPAPAEAEAAPAQAPAPEQPPADEDTQRAWWLAELAWQAETLGTNPSALASRFMKVRRQNIEDFPLDALAPIVHGFRPVVVERLRQDEHVAEAERYATWATSAPVPLADVAAVLAGTAGQDAGGPEADPAVPEGEPEQPAEDAEPEHPGEDAQPTEAAEDEVDGPHAFVQGKGPECQAPGCGFFADDPIHTVPDLETGGGQ